MGPDAEVLETLLNLRATPVLFHTETFRRIDFKERVLFFQWGIVLRQVPLKPRKDDKKEADTPFLFGVGWVFLWTQQPCPERRPHSLRFATAIATRPLFFCFF